MTAPLEHIRVTRTALTTRGRGTAEDPHRTVVQYWGPDGAMLWEEDPCAEKAGVPTPTPDREALEAALERARSRADQLAAEVGELKRAADGAIDRESHLTDAINRWKQLAHLAMDRATQADRADLVKDARVLGLKL